MNVHLRIAAAAVLGLGALALTAGARQAADDDTPEGIEVLARGPVHEAYAGPAEPRPVRPPVVDREPPGPIDEVPPDQRPEGDDVVWIPGYWDWDDEAREFLWVSGFWRLPPPERTWVPGHWQEVDDGWRRVPGFWAALEHRVEYLPPPPDTLETGPSTPAPGDDSVYVPGCWVWQDGRYAWRPGFWVEYRVGWVWVPAHYVWAPGGCVFVEGYWDRPLHDRGLLFAPIRIVQRTVVRTYVPRYVIQPDFLLAALFVRPKVCAYYFGDYFDPRYQDRGFVAWTDYRVTRNVADVNFTYYRRAFGGDRWGERLRELYVARRRGEAPRPPRTLVQQTKVVNKTQVTRNVTNVAVVQPLVPLRQVGGAQVTALASLAGDRAARDAAVRRTVKVTTVAREERDRVRQRAEQFRAVAQQRRQAESAFLKEGADRGDRPRPLKLDLPPRTEGRAPAARGAAAPPPPRAPAAQDRAGTRTDVGPGQRPAAKERPADRERPAVREGTRRAGSEPADRDRPAPKAVPGAKGRTPRTPDADDDRPAVKPAPARDRDDRARPPAKGRPDRDADLPDRATRKAGTPPRSADDRPGRATTPDRRPETTPRRDTRPPTTPRDTTPRDVTPRTPAPRRDATPDRTPNPRDAAPRRDSTLPREVTPPRGAVPVPPATAPQEIPPRAGARITSQSTPTLPAPRAGRIISNEIPATEVPAPIPGTRIVLPPETAPLPGTRDVPGGFPTSRDVIPPRRELNERDTDPRGNPTARDVVPPRREISPLPGVPFRDPYTVGGGAGTGYVRPPSSPSPRTTADAPRPAAVPLPGRRVTPIEPPPSEKPPVPTPRATGPGLPPRPPGEAIPNPPPPRTPRPGDRRSIAENEERRIESGERGSSVPRSSLSVLRPSLSGWPPNRWRRQAAQQPPLAGAPQKPRAPSASEGRAPRWRSGLVL